MSKHSRTPRVHLTHHTCLVEDPTTPHEKMREINCAIQRSRTDGSSTLPEWTVCEHSRPYGGKAWRTPPVFTTDGDAITCKRCRSFWIAQGGASSLETLAWLECCRHRGAPSPLPAAETRRLLAELEAKRRAAPLERVLRDRGLWPMLTPDEDKRAAPALRGHADLRFGVAILRIAEIAAAAMDEDVRAAAMTGLQRLTLAAELAAEVDRLIDLGQRELLELRDRIERGEDLGAGELARRAA